MTDQEYNDLISGLFQRFPSFQKAGASAYKPGIQNMEFFDSLLGHPHQSYKTIHIAGTNGKGSVSNMLACGLASTGLKVGLYTSPHILDFRERMRIISGEAHRLISREDVWDFVTKWQETFDHLDLSFFEITTSMAFSWFAKEKVDVAVIETGLGGRLDSTNIISPILSVITNIGLDHCDMLGETLGEIAFEKAGIIKPLTPAVLGESSPEINQVFERKVLYTNLPETQFMGDRPAIMSLLTLADKSVPRLWEDAPEILSAMDLQGDYQRKNLRTVLAAIDVLRSLGFNFDDGKLKAGIENAAKIAGFHGRWERLCGYPLVIADIGHNSHGLRHNFQQLERLRKERNGCLTILYGAMADKDVERIMGMLPLGAKFVFVTAPGKRAMSARKILELYLANGGDPQKSICCEDVSMAVKKALEGAEENDIIYIGGSTYVVSEAIGSF